MTTAEEQRPPSTAYPWHDAGPVAAPARPALSGTRAGLVTRSLANIVDLVVVVLLVAVGYGGVAAARFLLGPTDFHFPAPAPGTLLLVGAGGLLHGHLGGGQRHLRRPPADAAGG
jgi:hypothetical protein